MVVNLFQWVLKAESNVPIHLDFQEGTCRLVGRTLVPRIQFIVTMLRKGCKSGGESENNNSAVEYPLGLKLIGLHIEDVSFATDQTERHLEVGNTGYRNYDSSAKRRLLVSLGIFLCIYYKGGMLGEQSASLSRASVLTERQPVG
ncbi:hypothetical protein Fot_03238 [Forsythia ovata]|uniref:Uncharacterized protein n=1 Tax=Forsythia ovata TaxID=205694 RepID=A0ABD1X994_9LAMI